MRITVSLVDTSNKSYLALESRTTEDKRALYRVWNYLKEHLNVRGLAYEIQGRGHIQLSAASGRLTDPIVEEIEKAAKQALAKV
jgi:CRISPR/Cas system-associated protein Cas10 (large subunit of type III CRISPR-Cas system)